MITPQLVQELLLVGTGGVLPQAYHPLKLHLNLIGTGGGDYPKTTPKGLIRRAFPKT